VPALNEAINSMSSISRIDLAEIKSMKQPPRIIKLVMKCMCLLLNVKPIIKRTKSGQYKPSYWRASISDKVLGNPNLHSIMENFDKGTLNDDLVSQLEEVMAESDYNHENAKHSCHAI
jgi:dynein heavy chain